MSTRVRVLATVAATLLLAAFAVVYLTLGPSRGGDGVDTADGGAGGATPGASQTAPLDLTSRPGFLVVNRTTGLHYGELAFVDAKDQAARTMTGLRCDRVYTAARRVLCLHTKDGAVPSHEALVLDDRLTVQRTVEIAGLPSRARLSEDGRIASWTVFVAGDSYLASGFSTRTSVLDLATGTLVGSLETFRIIKDGQPYKNVDVNFWGVTMAKDDRTFYATLSTKGVTYLVKGDLATQTVTTVHENVECPSLSPDGTRVVYKKRVDEQGGQVPWRLHVLDLKTLKETTLAETHSVDDQAIWLDDTRVAYTLPVPGTSRYDVWSTPADGSGTPARIIDGAASPAPVGSVPAQG